MFDRNFVNPSVKYTLNKDSYLRFHRWSGKPICSAFLGDGQLTQASDEFFARVLCTIRYICLFYLFYLLFISLSLYIYILVENVELPGSHLTHDSRSTMFADVRRSYSISISPASSASANSIGNFNSRDFSRNAIYEQEDKGNTKILPRYSRRCCCP